MPAVTAADFGQDWFGRRAVVTGATGFVGSHLARLLVQRGAKVVAPVRATSDCRRLIRAGVRCVRAPLEDERALVEAFRGCELAFHLAGAVDFAEDWPRFEQVNVRGTQRVLNAARAAGVRRLVHTSSIVTVGALPHPQELDETAVWNLGPLRIPYITTKHQAEELALTASGGRLEVVVVNPASVIGPGDFTMSEFGLLCRRFWRGRIPVYFGGGSNFVDVRDVAVGHLLAAARGRPGQRYLLGGVNRSLTAFFADLARVASRPIIRLRLPSVLGAVVARVNEYCQNRRARRSYLTPAQARLAALFFYCHSDKARCELGYQPRPFRQTVRDTYSFWTARRPEAWMGAAA